ncbi:MAG: hypothetical protein U0800_18510 [Isosphaeraceae bacterium]
MATDLAVEQRLAALEAAVAEIRHRIDRDSPTVDWIERFLGAFKDEPAFDEVVS